MKYTSEDTLDILLQFWRSGRIANPIERQQLTTEFVRLCINQELAAKFMREYFTHKRIGGRFLKPCAGICYRSELLTALDIDVSGNVNSRVLFGQLDGTSCFVLEGIGKGVRHLFVSYLDTIAWVEQANKRWYIIYLDKDELCYYWQHKINEGVSASSPHDVSVTLFL